jgi:SMC interacting uncharacterized protein involved in chromosome segregation
MKKIGPVYLAVFMLCALCVWGCGQQQKTGAINAKITDLETRHTKLEAEHRALQGTIEQYRKKLGEAETLRASLEQEKTNLGKQLEQAGTDQETLRKQVAERTQERDAAQANLTQFSKDLQALAGRVQSALNSNSPGPNAAIIPTSRRTE